ncbi:hypothetical protein [Kitasatospora sp. NPDC056181]|uniref:hypothetical protein n=1 Tax=Kitasatospora sp. NPDC056181 TaxID=3345737 RepID=UPI0035E2763A
MLATHYAAAAPLVTGRSYARRVASLTGGSRRVPSGKWVAEARGAERSRRAVACRIGRLTGTRAPRWTGEIGDQDWRTVLRAGAAALAEAETTSHPQAEPVTCSRCGTRLNRANTGSLCNPCQGATLDTDAEPPADRRAPKAKRSALAREDLAATAREFAQGAVENKGDRVVDRTRNGRVEALVDALLAASPAAAMDLVGDDERRLVERWSPFRNGKRHIIRCADGSRRFGNGEPAPKH